MPDRQCEFYLLRYSPDAVKEEFVNLGVVLIDAEGGASFADVRFTHDWRRLRCLNPQIDTDAITALEKEIREKLRGTGTQRHEVMRFITEILSNEIQVTDAKACITDSPEKEMESLAQMYLDSPRSGAADQPSLSGRGAIYDEMRSAFERAGVWKVFRKGIPVAQYSFAADPLKIDCGYKPNNIVRMFHALAFDADASTAKALAFSYPSLRDGLMREERAAAELTAVVAPNYDENDESVRFSMNVLRRNEIQLATIADLPRLAERARTELRM
jgi:hypothetical protein